MIALPDSWKREPLGKMEPIPYHAAFSNEDSRRLKAGFVPSQMEDKWFIYYADSSLFLHRSWTGQGVYRVDFEVCADGMRVRQASCAAHVLAASDAGYQAALLAFLLSNLLLGRDEPFPAPAGLNETIPGVYQHVISGTGYPEARTGSSRPWWKFWRD